LIRVDHSGPLPGGIRPESIVRLKVCSGEGENMYEDHVDHVSEEPPGSDGHGPVRGPLTQAPNRPDGVLRRIDWARVWPRRPALHPTGAHEVPESTSEIGMTREIERRASVRTKTESSSAGPGRWGSRRTGSRIDRSALR